MSSSRSMKDLPTIRADGTRIRQVITNLISNAAKFTEQGSITLNGIDLRSLSHERLLREVTVLFQYWVNYAGTLAETVAMGDLVGGIDMQRVKAACMASGVTSMLDQLPAGLFP